MDDHSRPRNRGLRAGRMMSCARGKKPGAVESIEHGGSQHMLHSTACTLKQRGLHRINMLIAILALGWFGIPKTGLPQDSSSPREEMGASAKTQILSRPTGAIVYFEGEYGLAGRAPYTIAQHLKGYYRIHAKKHGYEDWSGEFLFTGKGNEKLSIKLSPKTRPKALLRSALFPGWGQAYTDQKIKGAIIATAQLTSLGVFIYHNVKYNDALDNFNAASNAFRQANTAQDRAALAVALSAAQSRLDDRFEKRRRAALIAGTVYLYNLLDVLLFFPNYHHDDVEVNMNLALPPDRAAQGAMINVEAKF